MLRSRALVNLLRAAWKEYEIDHARYLAGAMVYYALVSLVPMLLFLLAALGLLLRYSDVAAHLEQQVLAAVEARLGEDVRAGMNQVLARLEAESVVATVISLAGLLWTASVLFKHLRLSFRAVWRYAPPLVAGPVSDIVRASFFEQAAAFAMVLAGGALLMSALLLIAAMQWLGDVLDRLPFFSDPAGWLLALPSPVVLVLVTFAFLFKLLPPVRPPWRHVWLAAVLCTVAWLVGTEILILAGGLVGRSPSAAGAIGGLLMIMLWMNFVAQLLFYGAEVCKVASSGVTPVPLHLPTAAPRSVSSS